MSKNQSIRRFFSSSIADYAAFSSSKKPRLSPSYAKDSSSEIDEKGRISDVTPEERTTDEPTVTAIDTLSTSTSGTSVSSRTAVASVAAVPGKSSSSINKVATTDGGSYVPVGWPPLDNLEPGWRDALRPQFDKPYFQELLKFLGTELNTKKIVFPPSHLVFSALNLCPLEKVQVVIIGQDPYHGPGQAHGLAFSVQKGVAIPPSLRNMITEAKSDVNIKAAGHGNLQCWSQQGVLLLNTVLTVRKGEANSHQKRGWEQFTDAIVKVLSKKEGIVYLLWGKPAQQKCSAIDASKNTIITSSHPSPLAAYKTNEPFIGSRCFSRCNAALQTYGKESINWDVV